MYSIFIIHELIDIPMYLPSVPAAKVNISDAIPTAFLDLLSNNPESNGTTSKSTPSVDYLTSNTPESNGSTSRLTSTVPVTQSSDTAASFFTDERKKHTHSTKVPESSTEASSESSSEESVTDETETTTVESTTNSTETSSVNNKITTMIHGKITFLLSYL